MSGRVSLRLSTAPAAMLLAAAALYVWMAPRGFEFTDESYALLNYLYWRDLTATVTFFGAYFELPFRLLGQSVFGVRVFSLVALAAATGFSTREILCFARLSDTADASPPLPFVLVGVAASFFYFGFLFSARVPSYNLLALCTMLVATAVLLRLTMPGASRRRFWATAFSYGVALGACALAKAPAAALTLFLHAVFFAVANRDWRIGRLLQLSALILAGVALNFALLQWVHPGWLSALREGVALTNVVGHGGISELARGLMQELRVVAPALLELSMFAALIIVFARFIRHNRRTQISIAVVAVTLGCTLALARSDDRYLWLPIVTLSAIALWSFDTPWPSQWTRAETTFVALTCLLLVLPLAFSFGTNLRVLEHTQMAAVFGISAMLIQLQRLADRRRMTSPALAISLALLCVPALTIQLQNTFDASHAYRLRTALVEQSVPVRIGVANTRLLVDSTTRNILIAIDSVARGAGFTPRQHVLDLTGDGPGLTYAMGGRPLGVAWLLGGYSGTEVAAARLIAGLPRDLLQHSWVLTSSSNPRRVVGWQRMLERRFGPGAYEWVGAVRMRSPYTWYAAAPESTNVDLWRPRPARSSDIQ